jgi:Glycosyltransferase family 87
MNNSLFKQWVLRYRIPILLLFTAAFVLPEVSVYFNRPARGGDIFGYFAAGSDALHLAPLYQYSEPGKNNTWPPLFSFFVIPLYLSARHLGIPVTKELWYFFNFLCLIGVMQLWTNILYGTRPRFCSKTLFDFSSPKVFVPFLLLLPAFVNNFFMLQINVFILFLVSLGSYSLIKNRHSSAGLCFGLAAALKAFPGILLLYLLVKKQWKTAAWMAVAAIVFSLLPAICYGIDAFICLIKQWLSISLFQTLVIDNSRHNNQSMYALWYRFLVYGVHGIGPTSLSFKMLYIGSIATITIVGMAVFARKKFDAHAPSTPVELAAVCILMNLISPIAWIHHFVFLYPAIAVAWWGYVNGPSFFKRSTYNYGFFIWSAMILLPYVFTKAIGTLFKSFSSYTFAALLLLFFMLGMAARAQKPSNIPL